MDTHDFLLAYLSGIFTAALIIFGTIILMKLGII